MKKNILFFAFICCALIPRTLLCMEEGDQEPHYYSWGKGKEKEKIKEEKFSWQEEKKLLHDSNMLDDTTLGAFITSIIQNSINEREAVQTIQDSIEEHSLPMQFTVIEDSVLTAIALEKILTANSLYKILIKLYTEYFENDANASYYHDRCKKLAQNNPQLKSYNLSLPFHEKEFQNLKQPLGKKEFIINEVQSPRRRTPDNIQKSTLSYFGFKESVRTIPLSTPSHLIGLKDGCLLAATKRGEVHCFDIKSTQWEKTLVFPGYPTLFCNPNHELFGTNLKTTLLQPKADAIGLISSAANNQICAYFKNRKDEDDTSYVLESTAQGTLIKHDLAAKKTLEFTEHHKAAITALLALNNCAYSASKDCCLRKWDINNAKLACINQLDEVEEIIQALVLFQHKLIGLVGPKKLVLFDLESKKPTSFTLFGPTHPDKGEKMTSLATFKDELLIAGTNHGALRFYNSRDGFNNFANVSVAPGKAIKSVVNSNDKHLLVHYEGDPECVTILSPNK